MKNIIIAIKMMPNYKRTIGISLAVALLSSIIIASIPLAIQEVINRLFEAVTNKQLSIESVFIPIFIWVGLRLVLMIVDWLQEIIEDNLFVYAMTDFRVKIADKLTKLSLTYFERNRTGKIASLVSRAPQDFANWLSSAARDYLGFILNASVALTILAVKFPPIALIVAVLSGIYTWSLFRTMKRNRAYWKVSRAAADEYHGIQSENVSFISHIRALGIERQRHKQYEDQVDIHRQNALSMFRFQHRRNFLNAWINLLMYAVPIAVFAMRSFNGQQQPTDIYLLSVYLGRVSDLSERLPRIWNRTVEVNDSIGDSVEVLNNQDSVRDPENPLKVPSIGDISLDGVAFTYDGNKSEAINGLSLVIPSGKTIAIVGRSGSGKSTLIKLLLRFYDPTKGTISAGNTPITNFKSNDYRKKFGVVMQDVALFNDTVANNIAIANPKATRKQIIQAAKNAYAHDFIMKLEKGYDTLVGERGVKLSGGEKQRVSIARAILRNPEVVILDEATSALDSESERYVQEGLKELLKNRTGIVIAHRLSTIVHADVIIVMDKGRIAQMGTYDELRTQDGIFAELLAHQQL